MMEYLIITYDRYLFSSSRSGLERLMFVPWHSLLFNGTAWAVHALTEKTNKSMVGEPYSIFWLCIRLYSS